MNLPDITSQLRTDDFCILPDVVPKKTCDDLLRAVRSTRSFWPTLFLSEAAFDANPAYKGVNPCPGRNLIEQLEDQVAIVLSDPSVSSALMYVL